MKQFLGLLFGAILFSGTSSAQEINFSRIQDMTTWYNQSLKTDKQTSLKLNFRNVQYQGLIAYNSISAIADIPVLSAENKNAEQKGYLSASIGAASDKSNQGILNNTLGFAGLSYAVPVAKNETYVAAGIQGGYFRSQLNAIGEEMFDDQFDQYGPVYGSVSSDHAASGWSYGYFNVNAGLSVFSNAKYNKWYIGASVMHANRPYSSELKTTESRLQPGLGIQAGYRFLTREYDECAFYSALNWRGKAYKHYFNMSYIKGIPSIEGGVGLGIGYRYDDAVVPNVELRYARSVISLAYDINISGLNAAGIKRTGLELAMKIDF